MTYIFGTKPNGETYLRTKDPYHTHLSGAVTLTTEYEDSIITDRCTVMGKYKHSKDLEGNCYDWYTVKDHVKTVDKEKVYKDTVEAYEEALTTLGVLPLEEASDE